MANQVLSSVENNFTKGLITEFTGLNFPENAATDTSNCIYSIVGDVTRREGFDFENFFAINIVDRTNHAVSDYKWNDAGGDGTTQVVVTQVGFILYFYLSSAATVSNPLSATLLAGTINLSSFLASGNLLDPSQVECQYSSGNGYLFVFHPYCDPFYCTYNKGAITGNRITVQIRDFTGTPYYLPFNVRPPINQPSNYTYNLLNQGWGEVWSSGSFSTMTTGLGSHSMTSLSFPNLPITIGEIVVITATVGGASMQGPVTSLVGTTLTFNATSITGAGTFSDWNIHPYNAYILSWQNIIGNMPSNADIWWTFKNTSSNFDPLATIAQVALNNAPAPKGHILLNAFQQQRFKTLSNSGDANLPDVTTVLRPRTGTWFQGRVFYTGVDDNSFSYSTPYTWTENIYFSQIITSPSQFGSCFQVNDPTAEDLFGLLPSDGGVISIQGCGSIYKLFPLQNALLVFAANGVWYITGSQGIGFTANDYTIVKLSSVRSISSTSFVDVQGLPMFWNEEGIYSVESAKQGTSLVNSPLHVNPLEVVPITVGTILSFYNSIPVQSKKYVRGDYNPIDYLVQWAYRSTNETDITSRYQFDTILNYNTYNKAFYPYSLPTVSSTPYIHGVRYVVGPGGSNSPLATFKYFCTDFASANKYAATFAEELDSNFVDWAAPLGGVNYESFFVTGYKLHGQGQRRFQIPYIYMYSRSSDPTSYKIQGLWDYAITGDSGRWSVAQLANNWSPNFGVIARRHKIRGQGLVLQLKVQSTDGMPFDIIGWSTFETQNTGV